HAVTIDDAGVCSNLPNQLQTRLPRMERLFIERLCQKRTQVKGLELHGYFPKGYSRRIEQIFEHACNRRRLTVKTLNERDGPSILQVESTQGVRRGADGTQRVA